MTPTDRNEPERDRGHRLPRRSPAGASPAPSQGPQASHTVPIASDRAQTAAFPRHDDGEFIGRFRILDKIGEGGMGVVYRATDTDDPQRRDVAVKVLRPHIAYDPDARTRLAREVQTLERVHHPNVAAVIDADPYGERPYIATEYVPGIPLDAAVKQRGAFGPEAMARLGGDLADAVRAIHAAGVVHRDLKPSNVLMVGERPVVIDFGIAHIADDARLTSTGLVMGTPGYLSPELVEGAPVSTSTDWWGWAATLAFAAQGRPPFGRGPMPAVLDRVTRGQADLSGVDTRLRPLLLAALSPVPSERPSAREVVAQMERYSRGEPTTIVPVRQAAATQLNPVQDATAVMPRTAEPSAPATQEHPARPPQQRVPRRPDTGRRPLADPRADAGQRMNLEGPAVSGGPWHGGSQQPTDGAAHRAAPSQVGPQSGASVNRPKPQSRPGEHDPRINLPHRSGTLQALFVLWLGVVALVPIVGFALLVAWNVAARFSDSTVTQTVLRRYEAGRRRSDGAVAVASSPWHAARAVLATVIAFILPTFVFAAVAALAGIGWAAVHGSVARLWWALPLVLGAAAGQFAMWKGAGSVSYRRGSRSLVRGLIPGSAARVGAGLAAALGLFLLIGSAMQYGDISWFPLPGGYADPLSQYAPRTGPGY